MYQISIFVVLFLLLSPSWRGENMEEITARADSLTLGSFVESDFPYITTCLDARNLGSGFPDTNVVARGLAIQLGNRAYACFDTDLLRWSVAWTGDFISLVLPAQGSYNDFFKRNDNELPSVLGSPLVATGMYAGWSYESPKFYEVRDKSQQTEGFYWGPLPEPIGRWKGVHLHDQSVILSYQIGSTDILELPGSTQTDDITAFTRTFRVGKSNKKLFLHVAEIRDGTAAESYDNTAYIFHQGAQDSVTAVALTQTDAIVKAINNRYLVVELPCSDKEREFSVIMGKSPARAIDNFRVLAANYKPKIPDFSNGSTSRWKNKVTTRGIISPDTAAFVTDVLTLPISNPWKRNIRVADISFYSGNKAAVSTYEGDIWIVEGINQNLKKLSWKRFASGFYEPMSIEVYKGQIFVYGKEGIVRLHDLNGDGEADFYENYCNLMQQSTGTREWAADMTMDHEGNFYIAKGGHVTSYKGILPHLSNIEPRNVYRASTQHSGSVLKISADGKKLEVLATGLRMPYIGLNRSTGFLTASDQQGNFVQATPIYRVRTGDYFGVPVTKHREGDLPIMNPVTWIPHRIDRSAASQAWIESDKMGPLSRQMVHFSFGRPGVFRVLLDSTLQQVQGGVAYIPANYPAPVLKGETNPGDGQLYLAGFNNYASNSFGVSALTRLRYTGKAAYIPSQFQAGKQGVLLTFDTKLSPTSTSNSENFTVKRWNYKRTSHYGSGHYKSDGSAGEEVLPVLASYLSPDQKSILLLIPDMKEFDQMEITYTLTAEDGKKIRDGLWFSLYHVNDVAFRQKGIENVDLEKLDLTNDQIAALVKSDLPVTVDRGKELFQNVGCSGCHSPGKKTEGMYGPPFQGIFGTKREMADGSWVMVDDAYLKESILHPSKRVTKGYNAEMPSFEGVLSESDLESIIFYIKTLYP